MAIRSVMQFVEAALGRALPDEVSVEFATSDAPFAGDRSRAAQSFIQRAGLTLRSS